MIRNLRTILFLLVAFFSLSSGSHVAFYGMDGTVTETESLIADNLPYGEITGGVNYHSRYIYTAKEWVPELSMYDFGARHYDPVLGIWNQRDKAGQFFSPYTFTSNNPLTGRDIDGREAGFSNNWNPETNARPTYVVSSFLRATHAEAISNMEDAAKSGSNLKLAANMYSAGILDLLIWATPEQDQGIAAEAMGGAVLNTLAKTKKVTRSIKQTGARELKFWDFEGAEAAYEVIRKTDDVKLISKNTGIVESRIARVKNHLFHNKHRLDDGYQRFDADPRIANAWKRLQDGTHTEKDIQLLEHELFESKFEGIFKTNYRDAHDAADKSGRTSGLDN